MDERGTGQVQRALAIQDFRVEWRHWSAGPDKEYQVSPHVQRVQAPLEGSLADRIVDHVCPGAIGEASRLLHKVGLGIEDDLVGTRFSGKARLLFGRDSPDDPCPLPPGD